MKKKNLLLENRERFGKARKLSSSFLIVMLVAFLLCFVSAPYLGLISSDSPAGLFWVNGGEVMDSNQTWRGNTVIGASQNVLVVNCTLTVADGNVTVYGNLTFQNSHVLAETVGQASYFFVSECGNLTLNSTTLAREFRIVTLLNAKAEIYDSSVWDIESRNYSRVRVVRSSVNSTYAFDDAIQDYMLTWYTGRGVCWGNYWCPRLSFYNCTVPAIEATNATLEIAHTTIDQLDSHGYALLKFDNMTITGKWTHNGMLYWYTGRSVGYGMYWSIQWGETKASGTINGTGTEVEIKEVEFMPNPPTGKVYVGACMSISFKGNYTLHIRIYYTDEQVANINVFTLKLYSRSDSAWQQLQITGVNATGKYVWGNITSTQPIFSKWFAVLGTPVGGCCFGIAGNLRPPLFCRDDMC